MSKGDIKGHRNRLIRSPPPMGKYPDGHPPAGPSPRSPQLPKTEQLWAWHWGFPGRTVPWRDPPRSGRSVGCRGWRRRAWRPAAPGEPAPSARPCRPGPPRRAVPTRGTRRGHGARPAAPACLGTRSGRDRVLVTRSTPPLRTQISAALTELLPIILTEKRSSALLRHFEKRNVSPFQSQFLGSALLQGGAFCRRVGNASRRASPGCRSSP